MRKTKPPYYSQVVEELLLYREYKQRVLMIREEWEKRTQVMRKHDYSFLKGIDYDRINVQTSSISDNTADTALRNISEKIENEFRYKLDLVKKIEIGYRGLDPVEQLIIREKYMTGRVADDVNVYTHPDYPHGKTWYYRQKDKAVKKYAEIRGFV